MTRLRKETKKLGIFKGLIIAGVVITSACIELAPCHAISAVLSLVFLGQTSFATSIGALLNILLVRSLFVQTFSYGIGQKIFWPRKPAVVKQPKVNITLHEPTKAILYQS